jgi:hypothetical protein
MHFDKKKGLSSNWVYCYTEDKNGNIWTGTHSGLNKLIPQGDSYRIFNFSRLNNYFGTVYSVYASRNNVIWCAGFPSLVRFHDDLVDTISAPLVIITSAIAGNDSLTLNASAPSLSYNTSSISFEFSSLTFINEKGILYSYRLKGVQIQHGVFLLISIRYLMPVLALAIILLR